MNDCAKTDNSQFANVSNFADIKSNGALNLVRDNNPEQPEKVKIDFRGHRARYNNI